MPTIDRQTHIIVLPDGTPTRPISGSLTIDDSKYPYATASIQIPTPLNPAQLDPRSTTTGQPPRVVIEMFQEFADSIDFAGLGVDYPTQTFAALGVLYPTQTFADLGALFTTEWNVGNTWEGRAAIYRQADLAITDSTTNANGTTDLTLASDEEYATTAAGTQLATWATSPLSKLSELVQAALAAIMPLRIAVTTDYDLSAAIAATPAQPVYTDNVWSGLDTYVQLAAARLYCDETRIWHLDVNIVPPQFITAYAEGFEAGGTSGWTDPNGTLVNSTTHAHTGTHALRDTNAGATDTDLTKTLTGLTIGATYVWTAWLYQASAGINFAYLAVDTGDVSTLLTPTVGTWTQLSVSFTATAATHIIRKNVKWINSSSACYWDDELITTPVQTVVDVQLAAGVTLTQFSDTVSRSSGNWANQVKVVYNWTTAAGVPTSQVDFADGSSPGVPGALIVETNDNTPFPGAGAAAALLNRTASYGHEAAITALTDLKFNPRQNLLVSLPTGNYLGTISAVTFDLVGKTMTVTTRNLA